VAIAGRIAVAGTALRRHERAARLELDRDTRLSVAVYVGEATSKLERAFASVPSTRAKTLEEAVVVARSHATPGGVVLLSPGCASFDMFRNFEERGARFEAAVMELKRGIDRGRR
jgi:UDP-N-acetylmuramoylalanine--D-glutamate ligase